MSKSAVGYELGSLVYEPFLGLCQVTNLCQETMLGVQQDFYELTPRQGNAVVKVPALQMGSRGIRALLTPQQIEEALETQPEVAPSPEQETYAQRLRRWTSALRSGEVGIGYVFLREWSEMSTRGVRFSTKETEMHENVIRTLTEEISEVLQISSGKASSRLTRLVGR
ncbi:MAG: hypothetical protein U0931_31330 [Vulcanimicrobiota bacterium]